MAAKAFVSPDEISEVISNSLFFKDTLGQVPIFLIGIHDAAIGLLLTFRVLPTLITTWVVIWVGMVIILLIGSMSVEGLLDAIEHAAPLGITLYLKITSVKK
ncbi:hypothetical protein HYU95_02015 [Candidatus Daviesbacteria bacterium]|nr:hypothetical protein [Candidatus Daviesbacteria bacterium]